MLLQIRPMLQQTPEERRLELALRSYRVCSKKQIARITGRQLLVRDLNEQAARWREAGRLVPANAHKLILKTHGGAWSSMSLVQKADFDRRAELAREQAAQQLHAKKMELCSRIASLQQQCDHGSAGCDKPMRLSSSRLSSSELVELNSMFESSRFAASHVEEWRRRDEAIFHPPCRSCAGGFAERSSASWTSEASTA
jgi:hypothetical protein